ncbi:hypothetical protein APY03_4824 [Variovorax sp. WDL1]|nr:hypothetical protein APY03_4824 [Variovorax sp. WDL1]
MSLKSVDSARRTVDARLARAHLAVRESIFYICTRPCRTKRQAPPVPR